MLPFEADANEIIANDPKLINFRYFFTRKVMFVKESHAVALFPGGFGTHDEGFEALTLMQTGKEMETMTIVLGIYLILSLIISAIMNWFNRRIELVAR